ncbi:hypothetical protein ACFY36_00805 [Actinoplanes sp. NPDC000266]
MHQAKLDKLASTFDAVISRESKERPTVLGIGRVRTFVIWLNRRVLPPAGTLFALASCAFWTYSHSWNAPPVQPEIQDGIASLAAVITVNVFTVQLSTTRLPGFMARAAGHPWQLTVAYVSSFLVLISSFKLTTDGRLSAAFSWLSLAAVVVFGVSLLLAVLRWIGRTNAAEAAKDFTSLRQSRFATFGRRLGRRQAAAMEMSEALDSIPIVVKTIDQVLGERSAGIEQKVRGFFMLSRRHLRRLLEQKEFEQGTRVRIASGLGTLKDAQEEVINLVPGRNQVVRSRLFRLARKVVKIHGPGNADFVSSSLVSMISLSNKLAESGETGAARSVSLCAVRLMQIHSSAARRARRRAAQRQAWRAAAFEAVQTDGRTVASGAAKSRSRDSAIVPMDPALKELVDIGVSSSVGADTRVSELGLLLIDTLLRSTGKAEAVGEMLLHKLPAPTSEHIAAKSTEIAWRIGVHALKHDHRILWQNVLEWLERAAEESKQAARPVMIAGALVAASCRFDADLSHIGIEAFVKLTAGQPDEPPSVEGLWHIGASALSAGNPSVAVIAARAIHSRRQSDLLYMLDEPDRLSNAKFRADLRGGYLGDLGTEALVAFARYPKELDGLV